MHYASLAPLTRTFLASPPKALACTCRPHLCRDCTQCGCGCTKVALQFELLHTYEFQSSCSGPSVSGRVTRACSAKPAPEMCARKDSCQVRWPGRGGQGGVGGRVRCPPSTQHQPRQSRSALGTSATAECLACPGVLQGQDHGGEGRLPAALAEEGGQACNGARSGSTCTLHGGARVGRLSSQPSGTASTQHLPRCST